MTDEQMAPNGSVASYGAWESPITAELVARSPNAWIGQLYAENDILYLLRRDSEQGGRGIVSRLQSTNGIEEFTPRPYYARTRVYEYGGACFAVAAGTIYFSNYPDDRLYRHVPGQEPTAIIAEGAMRYADLVIDHARHRLICIREDRRGMGEPKHSIAAVNLDGDEFGDVLFEGSDFVAFPVISPAGDKLAWVAWNHPNMPFYSSSLWLADIQADGALANVQQVTPEQEESITDPRFSPDGELYFCSDRSNYWNLYRYREGEIQHVYSIEAELGNPFWNIGLSMYRFLSSSEIFAAYNDHGSWRVGAIDTETGECREIPTAFTFIIRMEIIKRTAYMVAASPTLPRSLVRLDIDSGEMEILDSSVQYEIDEAYLSPGEHIAYPTDQGLEAYGFYHPPQNPQYKPPPGELPPLIVDVHGGPTGSTKNALDMGVQYYTSRGFAVLRINYGGSAGYGRKYRNRLRGQWGIVDVEDAINGARYLVEKGLADPERTIIRGGSAGGFTTFAALAFADTFRSGSSLFGISDVEIFHKETHKYESHYCETLVGPYPEARALYRERSAIARADEIDVPLIIFQGAEDRVVPPNQSQFMADSLRKRGVPVVYIEFEGEAHGFRKFETNVCVLQSELSFWGQVFGFEPADDLPPLTIENL